MRLVFLERKSLSRHAIRGRFSMWLTTLAALATPQLRNGQLAFGYRATQGTQQAERRLRRRERSDRCSRIAFRPLLAFGDSRLRSKKPW